MKFGVREICDVVLKAKAAQKIGNKVFYKNEPVLYFDSLKTSSMEGAATTVYAQGGRGNARLVAWEGERTVTFTMEDALISPAGFSILTGAGLIDAQDKPVIMHTTEQTDKVALMGDSGSEVTSTSAPAYVEIELSQKPYLGKNNIGVESTGSGANPNVITYTVNGKEDFVYVMVLDENGEVSSEPYIASEAQITKGTGTNGADTYKIRIYAADEKEAASGEEGTGTGTAGAGSDNTARYNDLSVFTTDSVVLVDYYVEHTSGAFQVDITPDKFGGNFYLEASTLFRDTNGVDMPAEFVIPNCKVQSNFTFTMAASGDPSTFTFTMDAFPDYTRWNKTKKVYAAIQVLELGDITADFERLGTAHNYDNGGDTHQPITQYNAEQRPYIEENF